MSQVIAEHRLVAEMPDADEPKPSNEIHSTGGAKEYGFKAALVGGATVYGWAARTILQALGDRWLEHGFAHARFRQPVYPDERLRVTVMDDGSFAVQKEDGVVSVEGHVGLGDAPWLADMAYPNNLLPQKRALNLPHLSPENVPVGQDLATRLVACSVADVIEFARFKQRETLPQFVLGVPRLHPGWLAAQPIHWLHHSYEYGPAIHAESHIQHLACGMAGQTVLVAGRCVNAYERKGHQYVVNDCLIRGEEGLDLARIRHTVIYQVAKRQR